MPTTDQMEKSFNSYATCTKNSITRRLATVTLLIVALLITACVESNEPIPTVSANMTRTEPTNTVAPESTPLAPAPVPVPTPTVTTAAQTASTSASAPTSTATTAAQTASTSASAPTSTATTTAQTTSTSASAPTPTSTTAAQTTSTSKSAPTPTSTTTTVPKLPKYTSTPTPIPTATSKPSNTATAIPPTPTIAPHSTATTSPTPTVLPTEPTTTPELVINQERADEGESIYLNNCSGCHSQGLNKIVGPGHENVYETAKTRVTGLSPEVYLTQSITDPTVFVVPGFLPIMPSFSFFSDEHILALVEFLKTL